MSGLANAVAYCCKVKIADIKGFIRLAIVEKNSCLSNCFCDLLNRADAIKPF